MMRHDIQPQKSNPNCGCGKRRVRSRSRSKLSSALRSSVRARTDALLTPNHKRLNAPMEALRVGKAREFPLSAADCAPRVTIKSPEMPRQGYSELKYSEIGSERVRLKASVSASSLVFVRHFGTSRILSCLQEFEYYENAQAANTIEEQQEWARKADLRIAEGIWVIRGPRAPLFNVHQPWLKGYNGEGDLGNLQRMPIYARLWIDKE